MGRFVRLLIQAPTDMFEVLALSFGSAGAIASAITLFHHNWERFSRADIYTAVGSVVAIPLAFVLVVIGYEPTVLIIAGTSLASYNWIRLAWVSPPTPMPEDVKLDH